MKNERNGLISCMAVASVCWSLFVSCIASADSTIAELSTKEAKYRQPKALLLDRSNEHLLVANSGTGELEVYHTQSNRKLSCVPFDSSLDSLVSLGGDWVAACSTKSHKTHVFRWLGEKLHRVATISNSHSPVNLHWDTQTESLFVACLWSRRVESIDLSEKLKFWSTRSLTADVQSLQPDKVWDVPIAPRTMVGLGEGRGLAVADNFGRELLILDSRDGHVITNHDFFGTSIRGLSVFGKDLVTLHAMLNEFSRTDQNEIHWGVLMANDIRLVDIDLLLKERGDKIYVGGRVNPVGVPGNGSAEPTSMAVHSSGKVAVSVGGTDMLAIGQTDGYTYKYIPVGRYPSSAAWSSDGLTVYVANQFDDTISVVDARAAAVASVISQGTIRSLSDAELGEQLFHSATLSHDRWLTCASCHVDGHTNGQLSDNFGDRSYGAPKRVPSLYGVKDTAPYTWLGHEEQLKGQIVSSIRKTMHSYRKLDEDEVDQIAEFMESLPPVISLSEARVVHLPESVSRGKELFQSKGCADCHAGSTFTSHDVYDVGLVDENRQKLFNPPSLRGVSQRGPELFHDCRANGIRGVLVDKKHRLEENLSEQQVADLIVFLNTL
ncbi:MAG: c-type cytochrome [Planctomycetota bacterium]|nr:c-type cytochrome [Planctomycetota bacterium]